MSDPHDHDHDEPRSFRLSRGPSDLGTLFFVLAAGIMLLVAPVAFRWVFRAGIALFAILLFRYILAVRRLRGSAPRPPTAKDHVNTAIALAVLAFWTWCLARAFAEGQWIDGLLASLLVPQILYLRWLHVRDGS